MVSGPNPAMARNVTREAPSERPGAGAQAIAAGGPAPLGATVGAGGVNFSVFAKRADRVEVLLYDHVDATAPARVIPLDAARHRSYHYWHAFVPELGPRAALCLPRARAVRSRQGLPVRRRQGAPRSVRPRRRRARRVLA